MESTTTTLASLEKLVTVVLKTLDGHERTLKFLQNYISSGAYFGSPIKESGLTPKRIRRKRPLNQKTEVSFFYSFSNSYDISLTSHTSISHRRMRLCEMEVRAHTSHTHSHTLPSHTQAYARTDQRYILT